MRKLKVLILAAVMLCSVCLFASCQFGFTSSEEGGYKAYYTINFEVDGGEKSAADLITGDYLEIVEFSDFQVDAMTGDIFGEIRLAYYHDGDTITPVSGGSVSGDLKEALKEMYMSVNTRRYNNVEIPSVTRLEKVTVTGIE